MESYEARLRTFDTWLASHPVKKEDLARAGQYYIGDNETKCYKCNKSTTNWVKGDDPYEEHKKLYPDCPLSRSPRVIAAVPCSASKVMVVINNN